MIAVSSAELVPLRGSHDIHGPKKAGALNGTAIISLYGVYLAFFHSIPVHDKGLTAHVLVITIMADVSIK